MLISVEVGVICAHVAEQEGKGGQRKEAKFLADSDATCCYVSEAYVTACHESFGDTAMCSAGVH